MVLIHLASLKQNVANMRKEASSFTDTVSVGCTSAIPDLGKGNNGLMIYYKTLFPYMLRKQTLWTKNGFSGTGSKDVQWRQKRDIKHYWKTYALQFMLVRSQFKKRLKKHFQSRFTNQYKAESRYLLG